MTEPDPNWLQIHPREISKLLSPFRHTLTKEEKQKVIEHHVQSATEETRKARESIPCLLDIPYTSNARSDLLDIYGSDLSPTAPTLLWVHGGAWITGEKDWAGFFLRNAHSWGFRSVIVGYPLMPDAARSIREMCARVESAVEKAMTLFPQGKFVLAGHSAGAQLIGNILCGGSTSRISGDKGLVERISGFAFISGLMDIRPVQYTFVNDLLQLSVEEAKDLSPVLNTQRIGDNWVKKKSPLKILVALGKYDTKEFHRQGKRLVEGILRRGLSHCEYWESEEDDHFTVIENFAQKGSQSARKLKDFLLFATYPLSRL